MARRRAPKNLLEASYLSARQQGLGPVQAVRYGGDAITLAVSLAVAQIRGVGEDGGWPTQVEYAGEFGMTERNAQREWARYRQVFGPQADPRELAGALLGVFPAQLARLAELNQVEEGLDLAVSAPADLLGLPAFA
jgi:hypothetical protein